MKVEHGEGYTYYTDDQLPQIALIHNDVAKLWYRNDLLDGSEHVREVMEEVGRLRQRLSTKYECGLTQDQLAEQVLQSWVDQKPKQEIDYTAIVRALGTLRNWAEIIHRSLPDSLPENDWEESRQVLKELEEQIAAIPCKGRMTTQPKTKLETFLDSISVVANNEVTQHERKETKHDQ